MKTPPNYKYLIDAFGQNTIQQRYEHMAKRATEFIKDNNLENKVVLNYGILNVVMLDYFADLQRLKDFEEILRTNKNKITAYMSYWWLRRRPLQVIVDAIDDEELVYVNEKFIVTLLTKDFMNSSTKLLLSNKQCQQCLTHIYYHLKYRVYTAQTLELMLMAADTGKEIGKLIDCNE